jgi:hypothetical protein
VAHQPLILLSADCARLTLLRLSQYSAPMTGIVWKNSQNDRSRKSRFRAPSLICAGNRRDELDGTATRGKIARAAEALANFPSRPSMAVQIVIATKNRVFPHNLRIAASYAPPGMVKLRLVKKG